MEDTLPRTEQTEETTKKHPTLGEMAKRLLARSRANQAKDTLPTNALVLDPSPKKWHSGKGPVSTELALALASVAWHVTKICNCSSSVLVCPVYNTIDYPFFLHLHLNVALGGKRKRTHGEMLVFFS